MKKFVIICRICSVLLIIGILEQISVNIWENYKLQQNFVLKEKWTEYRSGCPMEKMNIDQYYCLLNRNAADVGGYTTVFTNSKPIVYYQKVNGVYLPAHEIAAGTQLIWSDSSILGYGSMTFPTYQAEWRWSRPFRNVNEKTNEADADWYYIKTKDLQDIALAVLNSSDSLKDSARGMKMSIAQYANAVIHTMDNLLYQNGVYISPNLYQPIWTPLCTVLLLVFLLNVSVWFFARYRLS